MIGNNYLKQLAFGARANSPAPISRSSNCHDSECSRCVRRTMLFLKVVLVVSKSQIRMGEKRRCARSFARGGAEVDERRETRDARTQPHLAGGEYVRGTSPIAICEKTGMRHKITVRNVNVRCAYHIHVAISTFSEMSYTSSGQRSAPFGHITVPWSATTLSNSLHIPDKHS